MKSKVTTTTEEYNDDGSLKSRIIEVREEEDSGYIYPQRHNYNWWDTAPPWQPYYSSTGDPLPPSHYQFTCNGGGDGQRATTGGQGG